MEITCALDKANSCNGFGAMFPGRDNFRSHGGAISALFIAGLLLASTFAGMAATSKNLAFADTNSCQLNSAKGNIQHVIYIQFDNVHFTRDNANVSSDLEQMPHLLNFINNTGVLYTNHHTPLISHTATDILTSLTGVYGDKMGVPVANSFRYFNPDGTSNPGVSFAYWTDPLFDPSTSTPTDTKYNMLAADGKNAPAPWVPFTRAGCNFGGVSTANIELENIQTDIPTVFGANSPQAAEVSANPGQAFADFVGIAIHCAAGSQLCSQANGGRPDLLPDEPGGYNGFMGLFGHKYVAPQINSTALPLRDLNGSVIQDASGHIGFPGFDGASAYVSLSYVAQMQEHGVPVTYAYISDAHDAHPSGPAYGPGQAGYVKALKAYDDAFAKFFARLQSDGITPGNTLFVFTSDEGDHFVGGKALPSGCDGVTTPCTYSQIGEISTNLAGLMATEEGITTPFKVHSDDAPTVYITGNPARDASVARNFERAAANLTAVNPITGKTDNITQFMADPVEMKLLHMVTSDPARTPTFTLFGNPDYFMFAGAPNCKSPCVAESPGFAWNHGDVQPEITTTWLGMVGPGIQSAGIDRNTWSDHSDIRPTMLLLLGLKDDYSHDGRAIVENLTGYAVPHSVKKGGTFQGLAAIYEQINAPVGALSLDTLKASSAALKSNSAGDATYASIENQLADLTAQRDALASKISSLLEGAEFNGTPISHADADSLTSQAQSLLDQAKTLAG